MDCLARRRAFSIASKTSLFLAGFGLIVSYLAIALVGTVSTKNLLDGLSLAFSEATRGIFPDRTEGVLLTLQSEPDPYANRLFQALNRAALSADSIEGLSFQVRRASEPGRWYRLFLGMGERFVLLPLAPPDSAALERGLSPGLPRRVPAFLGAGGSIPFRVDLSRPGDEWLLVAEFRIVRSGLLAEARRNVLPVLGALLAWLALSLILARVFGSHLARPVRELSSWAAGGGGAISSRDLSRRDEVGELARRLADMRSALDEEEAEILDRARAMESMGRIDRAVLAGGERLALLDKVLLAVLDYAPARLAAVAVRDPDGGGFEIVALRGSSASPSRPGGFLPDELFPPALLVRYADAYEVSEGELGPELPSRLGVEEGDVEGRGGRFFANLPFAEGDAYAGALFLLRSAREPGLERLKSLADQVGVAFKQVANFEARERNWLAVVRSLTRAVDAKSAWTHGHSERVALASLALGRKLLMEPAELSDLEVAAVLHDVGKIGVPEAILDKPARLEPEEFEAVKRHPSVGADIVEDVPEYREVRAAIRHHHERWDGSGYPAGLKGEEIPLAARIIALADVYDAITDERPYRKGMRPQEARDFVERGSGSLFDPGLVRLFLEGADDSP